MSQDNMKVMLPMIRKVVPNLIAQSIVNVQPMSWPRQMTEEEQNFALLERAIPKMIGYRPVKSWFNASKYWITVLIDNQEQLETIRKAGFGIWIDNEYFFGLAKTLLKLQFELGEAYDNKCEGMERAQVESLKQAIDKAYEDYELMRRLTDIDNKMIWLLQTVYS
jgi:hypothetical protein